MTLPTGTITLLFTDIEGSTRLVQQLGRDYAALQAAHDRIMREACAAHHGVVVNTEGDAFFIVFEDAASAVAAAVEIQQRLAAHPWPGEEVVRVRMGMHTGQPQLGGDNYVGLDVHRAARIAAAGHGGQVLLSEATYGLVRDDLPEGVGLIDLGQHRLKDLRTPKHLYQLAIPGLRAEFPPLRSLDSLPNNLPIQVTSFVGREQELTEISELLKPSDIGDLSGFSSPRLITLIGPGGTGKTRLSLRVATEALEFFPDGAWLVEFAPVSNPQLVAQTVATTLSLPESPGRPLESTLIDYLHRRKLLLIFDNCEHLIDECARVADLIHRGCPEVCILASSREALGVAGERIFRVRSLPLPPDQSPDPAAELCDYAAVRLFLDRAVAVKPDFVITPENCAPIVQICRRLDGIPLAIELAAARVNVLSPQQIGERLDDRFRLLTGGSRTALPRQRTLAALIDWSYDLLSGSECILLRRLAVFSGGWTLEAAEVVCSDDGVEAWEVLDLLDQLVGKSLVVAEENELGMRYRMLETIRQYAQEKLAISGEADILRNRHLIWCVDMYKQAREDVYALRGSQKWVRRFKYEADNIQAARAWSLDHDLKAAMHLVNAFSVRWGKVGSASLVYRFVSDILVQASNDPAWGPDGSPENRRLLGETLFSAGAVAWGLGRSDESLPLNLRSVDIAREQHDLATLASALGLIAGSVASSGDIETAAKYMAQAYEYAVQSKNRFVIALTATSYLPLFILNPDNDGVQGWEEWRRGMDSLREGEEYWGLGLGHQVAASVLAQLGDLDQARYHAEQSLIAYDRIGEIGMTLVSHGILAELAMRNDDLDEAEQTFLKSLPEWRDSGNRGAVARILEMLAFINRRRAETDGVAAERYLSRAATLFGAAESIRYRYDAAMHANERVEYDAEVAALKAQIDVGALNVAWAKGARMGMDEVIDWVRA